MEVRKVSKNNMKRKTKTLFVILTVTPFIIWGTFNIDLGVMFNHKPNMLWVHAPSSLNTDDTGQLVVEVWDQFERISMKYNGEIAFSLVSYNLSTYQLIPEIEVSYSLPESFSFDTINIGIQEYTFSIFTAGIHYILVTDVDTDREYWSNPIMVDKTIFKLVWGDFHSHSMLSDGGGMPSEVYDYARYIARLDFGSVTDHGEYLHLENGYSALERATNRANDPGKFIALQGVEWTSGNAPHVSYDNWGHLTWIFSGSKLAKISADIQRNPAELWSEVDRFTASTGSVALAIPHHTVSTKYIQEWPICFDYTNYVRLGEAYSVHGSSLVNPHSIWSVVGEIDAPSYRINGSSINEALTMGLRLGLIANGDSHDGHLGHSLSHTRAYIGHQYPYTYLLSRVSHLYPSGITGAYVSELTRDGIFNALYNRRVISNSDFGRPYIRFSINDVIAGQDDSTVYVANATSTREIKLLLAQDGAPQSELLQAASPWLSDPDWGTTVQIFKNGYLWREQSIDVPVTELSFFDNTTITGASYDGSIEINGEYYINEESETPINPANLNTNGVDFYFVRILYSMGRVSAVGPIWVEIL